MTAKFSSIVSRWTERAKGAVLVSTLAIGIASGYAFAISPTVDSGRDFGGSIGIDVNGGGNGRVYTVPGGQQLTLTDIVATNNTTVIQDAFIYIGQAGSCDQVLTRLNLIKIPANGTLHIPLNTGLGFGPGKSVCLRADSSTVWSLRGYLSNAT